LRVADIIGLNAMEIAEKYSLSQIHDRVVFVESQEIWGTLGGDIQYAIKDVLLEDKWFSNIIELK
jgi:hypothetical protein